MLDPAHQRFPRLSRGCPTPAGLVSLFSAALLMAALPPAAAGQDARDDVWLVTAIGAPGEPDKEAVARVTAALREAPVEVIDPEKAASFFEQRHSRAPVRLQPDEVDKLQKAISQVSHHLALENLAEARHALGVLQELTPEVADYLNRKLERAEQIFQACLLMAHLLRKGGYREKAYDQAGECARAFPGFEPDPQHYPPYIIDLFQRAAAEVQASTPATVHIGATSGRECRARINGVDWGPVPTRVPGVRADEVRVQVDCGQVMGRIHRERIRPGDNEFLIDTRFDRAVQTDTGLWLTYANRAESDRNRVEDSIRVARVVGAAQILQVDLPSGSLHRIDVASGQTVASRDLEGQALPRALSALLDAGAPPAGRGRERPPEDTAYEDDWLDREPQAEERDGRSQRRLWGYTGAAVSAGALATGWAYWVVRRNEANRRLETDFDSDYDGYRAPVLVFAGLGSLGLSASAALALPEQPGVPWWSYLAGAGGMGLAAYGIYVWQQDERTCLERDSSGCLRESRVDTLGGPFLALQSLPLLAVPATYLVRHLLHSERMPVSAVPRLDRRGARLVLAGRF
jgi:hypothetical protein